MESVKLNIINGLLWGLKKATLKLLFYQAKYQTDEAVNEAVKKDSKLDLRKLPQKLKKVMLHDQKIIDKRWNECQNCEHLIKATNTCKKCGCFMKIKTRVATASCPVGKWDKEYDFFKDK